jgi:hypothetical protein
MTTTSTAVAPDLTPAQISRIDEWITKGIKKGLTKNGEGDQCKWEYFDGQFLESAVIEELRAQVWERLYSSGTITTRKAYSFGFSAGRDYARDCRKTESFNTEKVDDYTGNVSEGLQPYDRPNALSYDPQEEGIVQIIDDAQEEDRNDVLALLQEERPDDYAFLIEAAPRAYDRLGTSAAERMRLRDIRLWMTERSPSGTSGRLKGAPRKSLRK